MNFAWDTFKRFDEFELADITHAYPEWQKYKEYLDKHPRSRKLMNFKDFFKDNSDKVFLREKIGKDFFENVKSKAAELEFEKEEKARKILDC